MTLFWILAASLVALALAFVVLPLLRKKEATSVSSDELNLSVIRRQLVELDADLANGSLSEDQYRSARLDLEKELLLDVSENDSGKASRPEQSGRWAVALFGVGLPLLAVTMYQTLGNQGLITRLETFEPARASSEGTGAPNQHAELPPMEQLVERLAERLRQEPNNPQGWTMLARSYLALGRTQDAMDAYRSAFELTPDDPELLVSYAQALIQTQTEPLLGRPAELIAAAHALSPDNPNVLWLTGLVAFERGDYAQTIDHWQRLSAMLPPDSEDSANLANYIDQARSRLGPATATLASAEPAKQAVPAATAAPPAPAEAISVTIKLDPALADRVSGGDRVFIFARAMQGPRMPLAAVSKQVKDLPLQVTLDDSMAMTPQFRLSAFPQVVVGARVSKSGNAIPQSGDLEGEIRPVEPGQDTEVEVVITSVRP